MKSKYEQNNFAVFQGNLFSDDSWKCCIELHTKSKRIANKYEFLEEEESSELTDIHAIKENLLENAKKIFDEHQK